MLYCAYKDSKSEAQGGGPWDLLLWTCPSCRLVGSLRTPFFREASQAFPRYATEVPAVRGDSRHWQQANGTPHNSKAAIRSVATFRLRLGESCRIPISKECHSSSEA